MCYTNCADDYIMDDVGNCVKCDIGFTYNKTSKKCEKVNLFDKCSSKQTQIGPNCYNNCPDNFFMDASGNCIQNCKPGYTYNPSSKLCEILSKPNICKPTQTLINNKCYDACPPDYFMDDVTGECIQNCQPKYTYDKTQKKCL